MARKFSRPGLSANDLEFILSGTIVLINPVKSDIARSIKTVEKGSRKNKVDLLQAESAWRQVASENTPVAGAGRWVCPKNYRFDMRGTVIVFVRITDTLVGMFCERQSILPGNKSEIPLSGYHQDRIEERPVQWFNAVAELFWTQLSEGEIADLKQQAALRYLAASGNGFPDTWQRQRTSHLKALQGLQDPVNITELQAAGIRVAMQLKRAGHDSISWRDLKNREPSLTARYQRELLEIMDDGVLRGEDLENIPDQSPFNISFSVWRGAERIFRVPQLVLEIEAYSLLAELRSGNKEQRLVANLIKGAADWKWHPGQSNCVGWFRVHIDDENRLCFIDEVQSDTIEEVTSYLVENREILSVKEVGYIQEYLQAVKHWNIHGFSCLSQWVSEIGYDLGIHSRESAMAVKAGMTPSDRKWNTCYGTLIKRYSMELTKIDGYPESIRVVRAACQQLSLEKVS